MVRVCEKIKNLIDFFAIATVNEAMELRKSFKDVNILLLGGFESFEAENLIKNNIHITVFDAKTIYLLNKAAKKLNLKCFIHLKFDSGMNRLGYKTDSERDAIINALKACGNVVLEGLYTHFTSGDLKDREVLQKSKKKFEEQIEKFKGFKGVIIHAAATSTAFVNLGLTYDMVRIGMGIYGLNTNDDIKTHLSLKPALTLKAEIVQVKDVEKNETIGYNQNYKALNDCTIAVVSCGYADGFFRSNSNKGFVVIENKPCKICGNVCMDLFMADCTNCKKCKYAYLICEKFKDYIGIENVAAINNTIPYEIMTSVKRCERIYYG